MPLPLLRSQGAQPFLVLLFNSFLAPAVYIQTQSAHVTMSAKGFLLCMCLGFRLALGFSFARIVLDIAFGLSLHTNIAQAPSIVLVRVVGARHLDFATPHLIHLLGVGGEEKNNRWAHPPVTIGK